MVADVELGKEFSVGGSRKVRRERPRPSRTAAWLPVGVVTLVLAFAFASFQFDLAVRFGWVPGGPADPAAIAPPEGLDLPELATPSVVAAAAGESDNVSAEKVRRALAPYVKLPELGTHRMIAVGGPQGQVYLNNNAGVSTPASTMKIVTAAATLDSLGPYRTFKTAVQVGATPDEIILVGGGDPYLMRKADPNAYPKQADLATLAVRTAAALQKAGTTAVTLGFDDSLFVGPRISAGWPASYVTDAVVSPITALFADQGHRESGGGFEEDPAAAAAVIFADELRKKGISLATSPTRAVAVPTEVPDGDLRVDPRPDPASSLIPGQELATVQSAPVWQIVNRVLVTSDNEGAELLAHHVAIAEGDTPDFNGAALAVEAVLTRLGVDLTGDRIIDGSGLSRNNLLSAETLLGVFTVAASEEHSELRPVISGLPIAAYTGSLARRYVDSPKAGSGRVRAKTGTLTGVHGLAGVTTDLDGNVFTFVFLADRVKVPKTLDARDILEDMTAALAACHCSF